MILAWSSAARPLAGSDEVFEKLGKGGGSGGCAVPPVNPAMGGGGGGGTGTLIGGAGGGGGAGGLGIITGGCEGAEEVLWWPGDPWLIPVIISETQ